jgi:hypothetical protein
MVWHFKTLGHTFAELPDFSTSLDHNFRFDWVKVSWHLCIEAVIPLLAVTRRIPKSLLAVRHEQLVG